jgi:hypothetical protein
MEKMAEEEVLRWLERDPEMAEEILRDGRREIQK